MSVNRLNRAIPILNWLAAAMVVVTLFLVFFYAPNERTMGNVQRIFYFHFGSATGALIAFGVGLLAGIMYLRRRTRIWDTVAVASVEVGLIFISMTIASGSIWGKPAWNTWWLWSPRLTFVTVLWLVYVAYFMLRGAVEDEEKRGRFAAVYVIAAFVTVIMTYGSIRVLRDIHPVVIGSALESAQGADEGLQDIAPGVDSTRMVVTMMVSLTSFILLYVAWLANRIRLQYMMDEVAALKMRLMTRLQT
jgi:heme exporter protein C